MHPARRGYYASVASVHGKFVQLYESNWKHALFVYIPHHVIRTGIVLSMVDNYEHMLIDGHSSNKIMLVTLCYELFL